MKAPIDRAIFYDRLRASGLLGQTISQTEVDGLNGLFAAWEQQGWPADLRHVAYTMATAWHEARLDGAIREWGRGKGHTYGKPAGPYGLVYYGRSFSQLTWLENYEKFSRLLGVDLVRNPDLALVPETGAAILIIGSRDGLFRKGKTLARYFNATTDDPVNARDIINGDIKKNGPMIAGHHRKFLACLRAAELPVGAPIPVPPVRVQELPPLALPEVGPVAPPAPRNSGEAFTDALAKTEPVAGVPSPPAPKPSGWARFWNTLTGRG